MKFSRPLALLALSLISALLSTGCASNQTTVNTWRNPAFSPTPTNTIALTLHEAAKPDDAAMGQLLQAELQREGFALVPAERADYLLSYMVTDNQIEHHWMESHPAPMEQPPAFVNGQLATSSGPGFGQPSQYEETAVVQTRDIRLFLYTNPKTNPAGLQLVWQGTITVEKAHPPGDEQLLFKTLLHYFGADENGAVKVGR
jgi:hypothetical protein